MNRGGQWEAVYSEIDDATLRLLDEMRREREREIVAKMPEPRLMSRFRIFSRSGDKGRLFKIRNNPCNYQIPPALYRASLKGSWLLITGGLGHQKNLLLAISFPYFLLFFFLFLFPCPSLLPLLPPSFFSIEGTRKKKKKKEEREADKRGTRQIATSREEKDPRSRSWRREETRKIKRNESWLRRDKLGLMATIRGERSKIEEGSKILGGGNPLTRKRRGIIFFEGIRATSKLNYRSLRAAATVGELTC